jgi:hypothetical protein
MNKEIAKRIDNALDWMSKHDIKISDNVFKEYVDSTIKNLETILKIVDRINNMAYVLTSDMPMFHMTNLSNINNIEVPEVTIYKTPVNISYERTHVYNIGGEGISDRYKIVFGTSNNPNIDDGNFDELTNEDLLNLINDGGLVTEYGFIGINKKMFEKYLKEF